MQEKQVKKVELENGYEVKIFDASRRIAKDTFIVTMVARLDVEVNRSLFDENVDAIRKTLGDTVVYEVKNERNFVNENKRDAVFKELVDRFTSNTLQYLSHEDFPRKMVLKKFNDS